MWRAAESPEFQGSLGSLAAILMAQTKSNPHQAHHAPQGASVSLDKITAALQAAQQQLAQDHAQDPWQLLQNEHEEHAPHTPVAPQKKSTTTSSSTPAASASSASSKPTLSSAAQGDAPEASTAADSATPDSIEGGAADGALFSAELGESTEAAAAVLADETLSDMGLDSSSGLSAADAAMAAAFGVAAGENDASDTAEPTLSDADAAMAAAFGLDESDAKGSSAALSDADAAMAAAFGIADEGDSAAGAAGAEASASASASASAVMSDADAAMAAAFGMPLDDVTPPADGELDAENAEGSELKSDLASLSDADAAMAAAFGVAAEGHISKEKDEPESNEPEKTFSMEHGLSDADAAMAAAFGLTETEHNAALQDAGASLAAKVQKSDPKVRAVATPTMGADFEHAAEDMAMVSAHMQYIMGNNSDSLASNLEEQDFNFGTGEGADAGATGAGAKGSDLLDDSSAGDDFDVNFEDELMGSESAALETTHKDKAELDAEKAKLALSADDLNAIALYFEAVADAGQNESQLRPSRRLQLTRGHSVPYPFVGEYRYYFELPAPLEEDFITDDEFGLSTAAGYEATPSLSKTLSSMGALIRHFSNSSSYHLNNAQEWRLQLHVKGFAPIPVEIAQVSATSAGTGAGGGLVLKTDKDLESMGMDLSEAMLVCDEGKHDLMSHADMLSLLAQVVATDASDAATADADASTAAGSKRFFNQHCPELTSRLAAFVSAKKEKDAKKAVTARTDSVIASTAAGTAAGEHCVTGLRLEERSENSLDLSPDLSDEQKKAVTSALSYDLSFIMTGAQNKDTTLVRELILALMGQRKSVLVIDRDPANLHAIFRDTEKSLQEQAQMAEAYGDPSSALNTSYQDIEDQTKTGVGINPNAETIIAATAAATGDSIKAQTTSSTSSAFPELHDGSMLEESVLSLEHDATSGDALDSDLILGSDHHAAADASASASSGAAGAGAAGTAIEVHESDGEDEEGFDESGLNSTERMARILQRWHQDYPLLRLSADFSAVQAPSEGAESAGAGSSEAALSSAIRVSLESHLQQRLELLTQFGREQQSAKEERLANLERLLTHVQWLKESKLEDLALNLKQLSHLKRQRAEHQNKLNHMQQAYEHQHDLLLKALTPQIVALRAAGANTGGAASGADAGSDASEETELTMEELMDFSYEPPVFKDVEDDVQRLWQKIQDDQELYQDLKNEIKQRESIMRQVMYRALPRQIPTRYHRGNTLLSEVRAEYQQLVAQKEQLSSEYKDTTAEFNHLLLRLRFLKPQHQLHLKFEHLKNDNNQAVLNLSEEINKLHEHNREMFVKEQEWCQRCGFTLKEHEFNPQAWKELTSDFLEVKHGITSTQFLVDNWRYVADGSLRHLLSATSSNTLSSSKDDALEEIQKAAALSRAAAAAADNSHNTSADGREAEIAAPFEVNVDSISKQLSQEQAELSAIKTQLKITPEQVAVAKSALIAQCPVVGAGTHEAITTLKHSFNTVIINNAQQLLPIDFWLLTTLARERLVIIGDVMQMGGYAQLCGNSQSIRQQLYPSIFTLTGIKELLYHHQLSASASSADSSAAGAAAADGLALPAPAIAVASSAAASAPLALPPNVTLVCNSEERPHELNTLLNLFYAPFMALHSYAEQNNSYLERAQDYYRWSRLSAPMQEHNVHLLDTAALYPWMHEMTPQDYSDFNLASLLRYDGFNVVSAAYSVLLAFKLISSLLICSEEEEKQDEATSASAGTEAAEASGGSAGAVDDIDALLAANSPASSAGADDLDIDALLAANGGGAAAPEAAAAAEGAGAAAAFKPHLSRAVERDRVNPECAAEPRVIIVSIYPQQALFLQLMVQHLYQQMGFAHNLNLIAISDGATLSNASAPAVILDLTIDAPYHNGLYFDAPNSDPAGNGLGPKREEFLQQHLCSAISAAEHNLFVVGDITRLLQRSQHTNNALFQLLKGMMLKLQLPLYNAQSALHLLTSNIQVEHHAEVKDSELSFAKFDPSQALMALNPEYERERNYSDRMQLLKRLVAMTTESDEESREGALGTIDLLLRTTEPPEPDAFIAMSMQERMSVERIALLQQERAVNIYGTNEDSLKAMLHDVQSAQRNVLIMSPLLDEVRYQSFKPQLSALMAAGRKVMVMTLPLELYPDNIAGMGRVAVSNLKEMMVRVLFAERCFYQGILIDDHILWLTTFTPLAQCTHPERAHEMMIRIAGSAALNCAHTMHLPLLVRNIQHLSSCPICGSALVFNAQHAQLHCQRYPQCGFMLTGSDELNAQGELLCPNCRGPLHLHVIKRADGSRGFALRCTKCNPPQIYALSTSHLLLPYIKKQVESNKDLKLEEVQRYVTGMEKHTREQRQRLIAELEHPVPSAQ